ncbi:MAG: prolyl oligopeptidase family serine peptidase [Crocinitomicaceae bacterium]|nr:prolyl oligopeptidase family serine peptidase [Crocinitomicaceae bacterium]
MYKVLLKNQVYQGAEGRASLYDVTIPRNWNNIVILFLHGYMGYKDWGAWNLMEDFFVESGYGFVKFNASHNGSTISNPIDFDDLTAFSANTYSKELEDFDCILEEIKTYTSDHVSLYLIGHSRGGGMALLQALHPNVKKVATLASISSIQERFPKGSELSQWEEKGIWYRSNGRTKQEMPHRYDQYTDFIENKNRLNIQNHLENASIPFLIIHGEDDKSVLPSEGDRLAKWSNTSLITIPNQQHTFGASQPWNKDQLPLGLKTACQEILYFFEKT